MLMSKEPSGELAQWVKALPTKLKTEFELRDLAVESESQLPQAALRLPHTCTQGKAGKEGGREREGTEKGGR